MSGAAQPEDARELQFNEGTVLSDSHMPHHGFSDVRSGGAIPVMISEVLFLLEKRRELQAQQEEAGDQVGTVILKVLTLSTEHQPHVSEYP